MVMEYLEKQFCFRVNSVEMCSIPVDNSWENYFSVVVAVRNKVF